MHSRWMVVASAVLAVAAGACSSSSNSSNGQPVPVAAAATAYANQGSGTARVTLFGTPADFNTLNSTSSTAKHDDAIIDRLFGNSAVLLSFEKGSGNSEVDLNLGGEDKAADLVVTGPTLYLRLDLDGITRATGAGTTTIKNDAKLVTAELPFLTDLLNAKYVAVSRASLLNLLKQIGGGPPPATSLPGDEMQQIVQQLGQTLGAGQATNLGADSNGNHYRIVANATPLAQSLQKTVNTMVGSLSSLLGGIGKAVNHYAARSVTADVWEKGGKLSRMQVDLSQFYTGSPTPAHPVGVQVDFGPENGSIAAPASSTPADLSKLAGLISLLVGNSSTTTTTRH